MQIYNLTVNFNLGHGLACCTLVYKTVRSTSDEDVITIIIGVILVLFIFLS